MKDPGWPTPSKWPPQQAKADPKQAWWTAQQNGCGAVWELVYVADPSKLDPPISKGKRGNFYDMDHAYEKALSRQFLASVFKDKTSNDDQCKSFIDTYATKKDKTWESPNTDPSKQQG